MRDLWWLWLAVALVQSALGLGLYWAVQGYMRTSKHLFNAYRAELGEPPLYPDHTCAECVLVDSTPS